MDEDSLEKMYSSEEELKHKKRCRGALKASRTRKIKKTNTKNSQLDAFFGTLFVGGRYE